MIAMTKFAGWIFVLVAMVAALTACNSRSDAVEGVVRISNDLIEYEVRTTTDDDKCRPLRDGEVGVGLIFCEDWLTLQPPVPERQRAFHNMEIGKTYEAVTEAFLSHSEDRPSEIFEGIDPEELHEHCDLRQRPTGTITRVDESRWKRLSSDWGGVFDVEFEHACISGTLRLYRNIEPD